jgi:hypothetical protein
MDETERTPTESRGFISPTPPIHEPAPDFEAMEAELRAIASPPERLDAEQREYERMNQTYPGEYVAYRDAWEPPVFRREVVAHGPTYKAVFDVLDQLPAAEREQFTVTYCDSPDDARGFRVGYSTAGRLGVLRADDEVREFPKGVRT